jgi:hypothetical protein
MYTMNRSKVEEYVSNSLPPRSHQSCHQSGGGDWKEKQTGESWRTSVEGYERLTVEATIIRMAAYDIIREFC